MKVIRRTHRNDEVKKLQHKLIELGYGNISESGYFGEQTEACVRLFQHKNGLIADGIVGESTYAALFGRFETSIQNLLSVNAMSLQDWLKFRPLSRSTLSRAGATPITQLKTSVKGKAFLFGTEWQFNESNKLYWPGGASGVTLGPGYDMKERSAGQIIVDMKTIGLTASVAEKISKASGLIGSNAQNFARDNKKLVELGLEVEQNLLKILLPQYELIVKKNVTVALLQEEFDALVSLAYNPGKKIQGVTKQINNGNIANAIADWKTRNKSGGEIMAGLTTRRKKETTLYVSHDYGKLPPWLVG